MVDRNKIAEMLIQIIVELDSNISEEREFLQTMRIAVTKPILAKTVILEYIKESD